MNIRPVFYSIFALLFGASVLHAQAVRIQASDVIGQTAADFLKEGIDSGTVSFKAEGSINALTALKDGSADLAILAIPDGQPLPDGFDCRPLAFDVVTVVVNEGNPLKEINLATLSMILAKSTASADKWGIAGLTDVWAAKSISIYLPSPSNGITYQILRNSTVKGGRFSDSAVTWKDTEQVNHIVREQAGCIVVIRGNSVPGGGKSLAISSRDDRQYSYMPTPDSVFYGDYVLRLPFYVVVKKDAPDSVKAIEKSLFSEAAAQKFAAAGFIPVPKSERE